MEPIDLHAPGLLLRPWTGADLDDVWSAVQDPAIALWNGEGTGSREETAAMLARRADWSSGDHASFAVVDPDGGRLLGSVSLYSIDRVQAGAEIGYWVTAPARGRGIAAVAVDAVCRWALTDIGLDRIALFHAVENEASARVAQRAGFTREGRLRRSYRYGDGRRHDELLWSRLADDPLPDLTR